MVLYKNIAINGHAELKSKCQILVIRGMDIFPVPFTIMALLYIYIYIYIIVHIEIN